MLHSSSGHSGSSLSLLKMRRTMIYIPNPSPDSKQPQNEYDQVTSVSGNSQENEENSSSLSSESDLAESPAGQTIRSSYKSPIFDKHLEPCPVNGCPLNPQSGYLCGKAEAVFSRSSSTSGTDSSLRIRKTRAGCTERRWFISVSLAMIFTVLVASGGIYFGYEFLRSHMPNTESVFKGEFIVLEGDFLPQGAVQIGSYVHVQKSRFYQHKLDLIFSGSVLATKYLHNEVFLLEGLDTEDVRVHFNLHFNPALGPIDPREVEEVILKEIEIANVTGSVLDQITIDKESLAIQERLSTITPPTLRESPGLIFGESTVRYPSSSEHPDSTTPRRQCHPFHIEYCKQLPYNFTSFPNAMGHLSYEDAKVDVERFKEIVDSKCYSLTYEFVCQLLQPVCFHEKIILPCQDFCSEFMNSCANVLPGELRDRIKCSVLKTEADGPGACISKPGCVAEMRNLGKSEQICDGVVDCPDFSDELYCPYCPEHHFHCGVGKMCVPKDKMCDGVVDCDNGADEKGCLALAPHMDFASYVHQYYKSGYLVYQESGEAGKVCADYMNRTVPKSEVGRVLDKLGQSMCNMLEYRHLKSIDIVEDAEIDREVRYVDMIGPMSEKRSFIEVPCPSKEVVHIKCNGLECGRRPAYVNQDSLARSLDDMSSSLHGDWPWHVALYKNGQHVCDGTLIDDQWIMTTSSCFQGQGKSRWQARFASVRLGSRAPWEQKERIVGMVKTPVEGNSIVILKMEKPVFFSDFARPICLPSSDEFIHMGATCVTLGWSGQNEENHVVELEPEELEKCEDISEVSPNTICTKAKEDNGKCLAEEFAGAPLMCQAAGEWHLVGVSSWRKSCSSVGQRPRLFDRVSVNSEWAQTTIFTLEVETDQHDSIENISKS